MKRLGDIYGRLCSYANLEAAFGQVQKGKRGRPDIQEWRSHLEQHLNRLLDDLLHEDFRFGNYTVFQVFDPKPRTIYAADVRERVIHHAVINVCGERLEAALIDDSYACRRGKGQWKAVERAQEFARRHEWCLKLDIKSYFDSIDQQILLKLLARKIKDAQLLRLIECLLASYATAPGKGLPIGNLTSQYFANLYLAPFDRWASEIPHRGYVRYMDDMLLFGERTELREVLRNAHDFLGEHLQLTIKHGGSIQPVANGVDFLGLRIFPRFRLLNQRSKRRFRLRMRDLDERFARGDCSEAEYQKKATALTAFVKHADTCHFRARVCSLPLPSFLS